MVNGEFHRPRSFNIHHSTFLVLHNTTATALSTTVITTLPSIPNPPPVRIAGPVTIVTSRDCPGAKPLTS